MRSKKNREVNIFTASAIDLFASALGVFILLVMIILPNFTLEDMALRKKITDLEVVNKELVDQVQLVSIDNSPEASKLIKELSVLRADSRRLVEMTVLLEDFKSQIDQLKAKQPNKNNTKISVLKKELKKLKNKVKISEAKQQNSLLKEDEKLRSLAQLQAKVFEQSQKLEDLQLKKIDFEKVQNKLKVETKKRLAVKEKLIKIKKKLKNEKAKKRVNQAEYAAIIVRWNTAKHDIDLTVTDPKLNKYNFKHRKYKKSPGELSLDTRQGPGMEIWQTEQLFKGKYKVQVEFYNQYGNLKPANVNLVLFTSKGKRELPPFTLDISGGPRKKTLWLEVSSEFDVKVR